MYTAKMYSAGTVILEFFFLKLNLFEIYIVHSVQSIKCFIVCQIHVEEKIYYIHFTNLLRKINKP